MKKKKKTVKQLPLDAARGSSGQGLNSMYDE
jgi:hypothetical protein